MDAGDSKRTIIWSCCITAVVLIVVLVFFSFSSLDANEYGLDYSRISKTLDTTVYSSGYHFLGFGHKFIIYPSSIMNMEFSNATTADQP